MKIWFRDVDRPHLEDLIKLMHKPTLVVYTELKQVCVATATIFRVVLVEAETLEEGRNLLRNENTNLDFPVYVDYDTRISYPSTLLIGLRWEDNHHELVCLASHN